MMYEVRVVSRVMAMTESKYGHVEEYKYNIKIYLNIFKI